jgi:hypothetical protein
VELYENGIQQSKPLSIEGDTSNSEAHCRDHLCFGRFCIVSESVVLNIIEDFGVKVV